MNRDKFRDSCDFGKRELQAAREAAGGTGAGLAPTAAMWVATTFGTASTGTAISALSGAAAESAALARLADVSALPKGKTAEGMRYSINHEESLRVFLGNGNVPMDNSAC